MSTSDWSVLGNALRILAPALGGYAIYLLRGILKELRTLNERLIEVEQWQESHDKLDDTRFNDMRREIDNWRRGRKVN